MISRTGKSLCSVLLGPIFGFGEDLLQAATRRYTKGNRRTSLAPMFRAAVNITPFSNLFYARPALDYLILNQNPGSIISGDAHRVRLDAPVALYRLLRTGGGERSMVLELNADFSAWIDREAQACTGMVQVIEGGPAPNLGLLLHPDRHVAFRLGEADIESIRKLVVDQAGNIVGRSYWMTGKEVALTADGLKRANTLIDRICSREGVRDCVSRRSILDLVFDWIERALLGKQQDPLGACVQQWVNAEVVPLTAIVPIADFDIDQDLPFGRGVFARLSRADVDAIWTQGAPDAPAEQKAGWLEAEGKHWLGKPALRIDFVAEVNHAFDLAWSHASDCMALLQLYDLPARHLLLPSHAAPIQSRPQPHRCLMVHAPRMLRLTDDLIGRPHVFQIGAKLRAGMENLGLPLLSQLARGGRCDFEKELLRSLLAYGRAMYHLDPADKLLQVMIALEMFALRDGSEPIQGPVADRMAFFMSDDPARREAIHQTFRQAYQLRSRRVHHGQPIEDTATADAFLQDVQLFFIRAVRHVGRFDTRADFLAAIDRKKFGH